jgi:hypothetical protein
MPISDYANAFFFAHRTRVTFKTVARPIAVAFFFKDASLNVQTALSRPVEAPAPAIRCGPKKRGRILPVGKYRAKNKSPASPGFCSLCFRLPYFASLAI